MPFSVHVFVILLVALYCTVAVRQSLTKQEPCNLFVLQSKITNAKQKIMAPHSPTPSTSRPTAGPKLANITTKYHYENLVCRL